MKKSKQILPALFAALLIVSALAGCGKKNDDSATNGVGIYGAGYVGGAPVAATYHVGGPVQISNATGWVYGTLMNNGAGYSGGVPYTMSNSSGDQVTLYISAPVQPQTNGTGTTQASAGGVIYLSQSTMALVSQYCGQPAGVLLYATTVAGQNITNDVWLVGSNGSPCLQLK